MGGENGAAAGRGPTPTWAGPPQCAGWPEVRVERLFLGLVSLLLVGGFGGLAAGVWGGRPALLTAGQGLLGLRQRASGR